jgi:hypothetical protein
VVSVLSWVVALAGYYCPVAKFVKLTGSTTGGWDKEFTGNLSDGTNALIIAAEF